MIPELLLSFIGGVGVGASIVLAWRVQALDRRVRALMELLDELANEKVKLTAQRQEFDRRERPRDD